MTIWKMLQVSALFVWGGGGRNDLVANNGWMGKRFCELEFGGPEIGWGLAISG